MATKSTQKKIIPKKRGQSPASGGRRRGSKVDVPLDEGVPPNLSDVDVELGVSVRDPQDNIGWMDDFSSRDW